MVVPQFAVDVDAAHTFGPVIIAHGAEPGGRWGPVPFGAVGSVVDVAEDFRPIVAAARAEMEASGRMPAPLAADLAGAGLMGMGVTASVGGPEVDPLAMVAAIERLAGANPSAAWCVMISSTTSLASGWMDPAGAEEVFGDRLGRWAGTVAPTGTARPIDGAMVVDGRWSFGSGVQNATWMGGGALTPDGAPALCFAPIGEVTIIENWDVVGLRGTGSHDWSVGGAEVPDRRVVDLFGAPTSDAPLYRMGLFGALAAGIAAVGLGAARASIEALVDLAGAKTPTYQTRTLAQRPAVQLEVARATAALDAAGGLLHAAVGDAFARASAGHQPTMAQRAGLRRAASHGAETSATVAATMFRLAGGTAIRNDAPFARLMCDTQAVCQHVMVGPATWEVTGRPLLGLSLDRPDL